MLQALTATVSDWTARAFVVDGCAAIHMQGALLHNAFGLIVNAVAEFAGFVRVRWHLGAFRVELLFNAAAELFGYAQLSSRLGRTIRHFDMN